MPSSRFIVKNALMNPAEEIFPMPFTGITTYRETKIGMFIENFNENVILHRTDADFMLNHPVGKQIYEWQVLPFSVKYSPIYMVKLIWISSLA